jgi:hypothetical protein
MSRKVRCMGLQHIFVEETLETGVYCRELKVDFGLEVQGKGKGGW